MINAKAVFHSIIDQTNISKGLYDYLVNQGIPIDTSDLLRWQWVIAVSALDKYIHDIVRIGMVQEFIGIRPKTSKFDGFKIGLTRYSSMACSSAPEIEFENEIIQQHSHLAFQQPKNVADALSYIWSETNKWNVISQHMSTPISPDNLKTKLNNIVVRRNQIVHEGDCFSSILPLQQQPISKSDVDEVIAFIIELVEAISNSVI